MSGRLSGRVTDHAAGRRRRSGSAMVLPRPIMALAIVLLVALSACAGGGDVTQVTVTAGPATIALPAALSCVSPRGATTLSCAGGDNDKTAPHLALAPGTPLTVQVPTAVGNTPWVIVFSYVDAQGKQQGDRTAVFPPKKQFSYRLTPPSGAQMTRLEVQSLTAAPGPDGGVEFPAVGSWVLIIDPVGGSQPGPPQESQPGSPQGSPPARSTASSIGGTEQTG
ncbi:MAG: hypothetical protein BGO26_09925 [Actinobacteria bacterium 69-20]|jgi:hypothetical protein|nr:MAG: hypothetical protein BGO26_09925 [Actinobacteria bacterium 69-20]